MEKCIDHSVGKARYTMAIMTGGATQAQILQGNEDTHLSGEFILTASKKVVILTKDQQPVIVKRWKELNVKKFLEETSIFGTAFMPDLEKVYQDSDGLLWQKMGGNHRASKGHFTVLKENEVLYTIFLL